MKQHVILSEIARILLIDSTRPIRLISIPIMALTILGIVLGRNVTAESDLAYLFTIAPWYIWTLPCAYVITFRCLGLFYFPVMNVIRPSTSIIGIFIWSSIIVSGAIVGKFEGLEVLYTIPLFIEIWILARQIGVKNDN